MAVQWPSGVPNSLIEDGYNEALPDGLIRQPMDAGPPKVRRRTTAAVRPISGVIIMTGDQVETFDNWYEADLAGGALSFDFPHPRTGAIVQVMFRRPPRYEPRGMRWSVVLDMEVLP